MPTQILKNAARLRQIVSVFAKHGFHNVLERATLGRFILRKLARVDEHERLSAAERARLAFEELGPTFVKFGQLLSTRPNLIPQEFVEEFKKFHDQVSPVAFSEIQRVILEDLGKPYTQVFASFDEIPLAAASMAQVHTATLTTGEVVVVKIQRPGIVKIIKDDLGILYTLASLLERYIPEARPYNPVAAVDEFFKTLELETNFLIEANNIRRMAQNFADDETLQIPKVYDDYCTSRILVMERLQGIPLSQLKTDDVGIDRKLVVERGLRAFFTMVFKHGLFHGDLHAGNLFILPNNRIGLVDFGVVGRISTKTRDAIANMLVAVATEDYEMLTFEYLDLAPYNGAIDAEQFTKEIRDLFGPYYGMTFKNVNLGKLLMDSTSLAAKHSVIMPSELMLFFKAIVTVEGMGRTILRDFDILSQMTEFSQEVLSTFIEPERIVKNLHRFARDTTSLIYTLPRQLKQLMRKLNSSDFALDINISELRDLKNSVENSGFVVARGILAAALIIAGTFDLSFNKGPQLHGLPVITLSTYFLAFWISVFLFQKKK